MPKGALLKTHTIEEVNIDYNKYKFRYILVESSTPNKIEDFLAKHNYRLIEKLSYHDYLFEFVEK